MKISIITSAYNCETTLGSTIESVLAQSFQDFEYIIVNHGSTDGTDAVIAQYMAKDKRISTISMAENTGFIGKAMNKGIHQAKGEYLCFLDGDDEYYPICLETLYHDVSKGDYDVAICNYSRVDETGEVLRTSIVPKPFAFVSLEDSQRFLHAIINTDIAHFAVWWNKIIKKSYLEEHGLSFPEDTLINGDAFFSTALYATQPKMYCGDVVCVAWVNRSDSISAGTYKPAYFEEAMSQTARYFALFEQYNSTQAQRKALAKKLLATVAREGRLQLMKGQQEEIDAERARWEAHPLYQKLQYLAKQEVLGETT